MHSPCSMSSYGVMLGTKLGFKCWRVEIGCCGKVLLVVSNVWVAFHLLAWRFRCWRGASDVGMALQLLAWRFTRQKIITCSRLLKTGCNNVVLPILFIVVNNIVQHCYTWLRADSGSTMPNNIVDNYEQCGQHNIVASCYCRCWRGARDCYGQRPYSTPAIALHVWNGHCRKLWKSRISKSLILYKTCTCELNLSNWTYK